MLFTVSNLIKFDLFNEVLILHVQVVYAHRFQQMQYILRHLEVSVSQSKVCLWNQNLMKLIGIIISGETYSVNNNTSKFFSRNVRHIWEKFQLYSLSWKQPASIFLSAENCWTYSRKALNWNGIYWKTFMSYFILEICSFFGFEIIYSFFWSFCFEHIQNPAMVLVCLVVSALTVDVY